LRINGKYKNVLFFCGGASENEMSIKCKWFIFRWESWHVLQNI